jgi:hypothetical protein
LIPKNTDRSYLLLKIKGAPGILKKIMPPLGDPLTAGQIMTIETWAASLTEPRH